MAGSGSGWGRAALVVLAGAAIALAAAGAGSALACDPDRYVYAGVVSSSPAFGIRAVVTPVVAAQVRSGHIAAWVGVGGPGAGPDGADEWLQVGLSAFPNQAGYNLYYEVMVAGGAVGYHQLAANAAVGEAVDVAVLELHGRPNWWRVWVSGTPRSRPIFLPGSHDRWAPMATTESWDGGRAEDCTNTLLFRFDHVRTAHVPGGGWQRLGSSATIGPNLSVRRRGDSFLAAAGTAAERMLGSKAP
jgi:hypothetical protein